MAIIAGTQIGSKVVPTDTADTYPTHDPQYGIGGIRTTATTTTRNAIANARCQEGMLVYVQADSTIYRLKSGFSNPTIDADWLAVIGQATNSLITGTTNQVIVSAGTGNSVVLSTPQDIATSSAPQFARIGIGAAASATNLVTFTQAAASSGAVTAINLTAGAHTAQTASTEVIDVNFNLARTVQHATGALTTQRAFVVQAPTYSFVGASTITDAATMCITNAPTAGTNATITGRYALWVDEGLTRLDAPIRFGAATINPTSTQYEVGRTTGTVLQHNVPTGATQTFTVNGAIGLRLNTNRSFTHYTDALVSNSGTTVTGSDLHSYWFTGGATSNLITYSIVGEAFADLANSGTLTALFSQALQGSSLNLNTAIGGAFNATASGNGTLTNAIGIQIQTTKNTNPGLPAVTTNIFGLDIQEMTDATTATATAIYGIMFRGTGASNGITWGTDANKVELFRTADDVLGTNDILQFNTGVAFTSSAYQFGRDDFSTNRIRMNFPSGASYVLSENGTTRLEISESNFQFTQGAYDASAASAGKFKYKAGAITNLSASSEYIQTDFDTSATITWDVGDLTTQRSSVFRAPTLAFEGASIVSDAATLAITGAPIEGTSAAIARSHGLWVQGGNTRLDGGITLKRTAYGVGTNTANFNDVFVGKTAISGGGNTINLPSASQSGAGHVMIIKDESGNAGTNNITVDPSSTQTIDGQTTVAITANYGVLRLYSDGSNWFSF